MKRILVTGATGFIGGRIVEEADARGLTVRLLVRDPARYRGPAGVELFRGDLLEPDSLTGIEEDVDQVVHAAGVLGKWGTGDELVTRVNVDGAVALLERFADRPQVRYVHLSAGGVTGPVPTRQVDESYACRPATPYEQTKLRGETNVLARARKLGIHATVVRPTFTYGPGDPHKRALFRAVQRRRMLLIDGGRSVLHPVYIDDAVAGIFLAIDRGAAGEVYIVGGARPVTKRELLETIAEAVGVAPPRLSLPRWLLWPAASVLETIGRVGGFEPVLTRGRVMMMGDNFGYSIEKARRDLGYEPAVPLAEGIRRTVEAFRAEGYL